MTSKQYKTLSPQRSKRLQAFGCAGLALAVFMALSGCAEQLLREQAQTQVEQGQYEQAVQLLEMGVAQYPESALLRSGLIQSKDAVMSRLLAQAASAKAAGRLEEAQTLLQRAVPFDTTGSRVSALLEDLARQIRVRDALVQTKALLAKKEQAQALDLVNATLKDAPTDPDLLAMQRRLELQARQAGFASGQLALTEGRTISLDFRDASLRTVLDVVSRNSGVNFIFDKDLRPDSRVTVLLRDARVEDAIDLLVSTHQLAKKVVDARTILIYSNTPDKQREHQEQLVKVFYLSSAEAKGAAVFLKSMLKINEPFVDERSNMLALRDSAQNIQLAERLVSLYDSKEPEVLLDVEVIEVSSTRLTQLGVKFPDTFSLTPLAPGGAATGLTLGNVNGINADRIGLSVSGLLFNLKRQVGDVNVLANPKIMARNKEKAKIMIGDKITLVTATAGTGGFVSDSVSYLDVGLKLEVEPTVYVDDEVSIKVALEVSSLGSSVKTSSGTQAFQIGTRNASTTLRLRDGETQMLAGLISREDRTAASRVPGAGDLPVLGRVFSNQQDDNTRTELVLAITPRIIRNQRYPDITQTELSVGTDTQPRFKNPGAGWGQQVNTVAPANVATVGGAGMTGIGLPMPAGAATGTAASLVAGNVPELSWLVPPEVKAGDTFEMALNLKSGVPLRGGPFQISYPKDKLTALDVGEGTYFSQNGSTTSFTQAIEVDAGRVKAGIIRHRDEGTAGKGSVLTIKFKALQAGAAAVTLTGFDAIGLTDAQRPTLPISAQVVVK